ncbi:uncharacterized protein DS421_8g240470 [Arachis hypogaea]|nr:uncharacterized protein DS421_8g240470 [Arachis hypogaea]
MEESRLIPVDFDEDRIFYLHVDPQAVTHELPSLFYRKVFYCYILHGFHNLVTCYGLSHGGWMKLLYVGEDIFVVMKVKDSFMMQRDFSYPTSNVLHKNKPPANPLSAQQMPRVSTPSDLVRSNYADMPVLEVNCKIALTAYKKDLQLTGFQGQDGFLSASPLSKTFLHKDLDRSAASASHTMPNKCNKFGQDPAQVSPQASPYCNGTINHVSEPNQSTTPLTTAGPDSNIQGPHVYRFLKLLTSNQVNNSSVIIPLRFAESAFPSRHNHVKVIMDNGSCYRMGLRWSKKKKAGLYLTRGWKLFAKYNGLKSDTVLQFSVFTNDETTMHVKILKM